MAGQALALRWLRHDWLLQDWQQLLHVQAFGSQMLLQKTDLWAKDLADVEQ